MEAIDAPAALSILRNIARAMEENKPRLTELDQVIGDGDLGLTMTKGFAGAAKDAENFNETDPGKFFQKAGMAINKYAPSTMGTVLATGFMRGGKAVIGRGALDSAALADFFKAFLDGVMERGKVKPGEKTPVDAIFPAAEAARQAAGKPLPEAMKAIAIAANQGREAAKNMMAQHGKAAVFRERTIGLEDPGSAAFCLVIQGFEKTIN